jgi:hypothetical protein
MAKTKKADVDSACSAYSDMASQWTLIDDLLGGTEAMQANAGTYLPKFEKETPKHYRARVANSTLFNAYGDTANNICSKPFSKPVTIQGKLPEPLNNIEDDTDGQGKPLIQLARDIFRDFVNRGLSHILVDYPLTVNEEGKTPNLKQERDKGYKPLFVHVRPEQLIGWRVEKSASGLPELTQIRIKENQVEPDGEWGEQNVSYIRVIRPTEWILYRKTEDEEEYTKSQEGKNSLGKVPLITGYANQTGFLTAEPPLKELAEVNLAHYRSDSDQRNILHYARVATLVVLGFTEEEANKIALGPNQIISSTNENAKVEYAEHSGKAIEAGAKDIERLEERMMVLGLQPFLRKIGNQTATGQSIDESRANSDIQAWVLSEEEMIYQAYMLAAEWIKTKLPEDFKVDIFNDFALLLRAIQDIEALIKIRQASEISRETFLREIKRRAILSETVEVKEEIERIEDEGPALGTIGMEED